MKLEMNTVRNFTMVAMAAVGLSFAPDARACGVRPGFGIPVSGLLTPLEKFQAPASFVGAMPALPAGQIADADGSDHPHAPIVGMWTVKFYVETGLWDTAIEQFYADGNEMTNDIQVPPAAGNICWGVWEKVSKRSYKMRHIGWSFDASGTYMGRFYLTATLDMDAGRDTFSGKFVADQEDLSGNFIPSMHAAGVLKAERFTVD